MFSSGWYSRRGEPGFKGSADTMARDRRVMRQEARIKRSRSLRIGAGLLLALVGLIAAGCTEKPHQIQKLRVAAVFATPLEEPWVEAIHQAAENLSDELAFEYVYTDAVKEADFEERLREYAEADPDVIIGDAFFAEDITRRVAREYPNIAFCFASSVGAAQPNFSVFDSWTHEAAFVAGMIAGRLTRSNKVGIVSSFPIPAANRITNAFIEGAREVNPEVQSRVTHINAWFDPAKAGEAAAAMIGEGIDVMYAERDGVIEACDEQEVPVFGNLIDQGSQSQSVVTSVVWDMTPTLRRLVNSVRDGTHKGEDLGEWSSMSKLGSRLAPFTPDWEARLGSETLKMVQSRTDDIISGKFAVPIIESDPSQR